MTRAAKHIGRDGSFVTPLCFLCSLLTTLHLREMNWTDVGVHKCTSLCEGEISEKFRERSHFDECVKSVKKVSKRPLESYPFSFSKIRKTFLTFKSLRYPRNSEPARYFSKIVRCRSKFKPT